MGPLCKILFIACLLLALSSTPAEGKTRRPRYFNYYRYNSYNRYTVKTATVTNSNDTACNSGCVAGSVFTTLATQPCLICCLIVVAYFMCKCSCAACNGVCKSSNGHREESVIWERSNRVVPVGRNNDIAMVTIVEDTPPPYSPDMEKKVEKLDEEKPPEYEDVYCHASLPESTSSL